MEGSPHRGAISFRVAVLLTQETAEKARSKSVVYRAPGSQLARCVRGELLRDKASLEADDRKAAGIWPIFPVSYSPLAEETNSSRIS